MDICSNEMFWRHFGNIIIIVIFIYIKVTRKARSPLNWLPRDLLAATERHLNETQKC